MKKIYFKSIYILILILFSCGGSGGDDGGGGGGPVDPPPTPQKPQKAVLSKPENNSECLEVDAVKFEWNTAANTSSYTLNVKNLFYKRSVVDFLTFLGGKLKKTTVKITTDLIFFFFQNF